MAITTQHHGAPPRFGSIAVASDRTKAFQQAIRHSARVKVLKVALPVLAVCTCALYIVPSQWKIEVAGNEVVLDAVDVSSGDLKMTNPRIKGQNKTQGKYDVRAVSATQTIADPDTLNLNEIDADVINQSGETTKLKAPGGIYRSKLEEMVFNQGVVIERSSGLIARLKSASAFFAKNLVTSREPVEVLLRESVIRANSLDLYTDKSNAVFTGDVSVHLVREATDAATPQPAPEAAVTSVASYQLDPKKPIDITSNSLEVDDLKKLAIFRQNVNAIQGEFNIKSDELQVSYAATEAAAGAVQTPGAADIKYIEARGNVLVTSKENQTARADTAIYDAATQKMTLFNNVTVAQDKNVIQSDSVILDAASGKSFFQMNLDKRLKAVFTPKGAADPAAPVKVAAKPQPVKSEAATAPGGLIASADAKKPINIEARSLEVDDKKQVAFFRENVSATQGDFNIRSKELEVAYATAGGAKPASTTQSAGDIKSIIARGKVLVVSKEQNASSDKAVFDVKSQTVTLTENVVVTQGQNIIKGDKLIIDVTTGRSTFQMKENSGRTSAVFEAKGGMQSLGGGDAKKEKKGAEKKAAP